MKLIGYPIEFKATKVSFLIVCSRAVMALFATFLFFGCASYENREWKQTLYADGEKYVLRGPCVFKTATHLSVDGTFKKYTYLWKWKFHLYKEGVDEPVQGPFVVKGSDCISWQFDYFPEADSLIGSLYDDSVV